MFYFEGRSKVYKHYFRPEVLVQKGTCTSILSRSWKLMFIFPFRRAAPLPLNPSLNPLIRLSPLEIISCVFVPAKKDCVFSHICHFLSSSRGPIFETADLNNSKTRRLRLLMCSYGWIAYLPKKLTSYKESKFHIPDTVKQHQWMLSAVVKNTRYERINRLDFRPEGFQALFCTYA